MTVLSYRPERNLIKQNGKNSNDLVCHKIYIYTTLIMKFEIRKSQDDIADWFIDGLNRRCQTQSTTSFRFA